MGNSPTNFTDPLGLGRQAVTAGSDLGSTYSGFISTLNGAASNLGLGGTAHFALDVVATSEIPVVSQLAGAASAAVYAVQGDWTGASLAGAGILPAIGMTADATRMGSWGARVAGGTGSVSARTPVGRKGQHLGGFDPKKPTNAPSNIGDRQFSGHAFDRMQSQGIPPSAVNNTITNGRSVTAALSR